MLEDFCQGNKKGGSHMNQLSHQYGTYEKQEELLAMIKDIDQLFYDNDIEYSLSGGSLLGAIREKGFIPWDDDIDIMVDRKNYNKILALFWQGNGSQYRLNRYLWVERIQRTDDKRDGLFASTIDVFVMDHCPDNAVIQKIKLFLIMMLQGMMKEEHVFAGQSGIAKACLGITWMMGKPFPDDLKYRWYQKAAQIGNEKESKYITGYTDLFKCLKYKYTNQLFQRIIRQPFEDSTLPITAEYDSYLKTQYGDYMTPPEEKDRIPVHTLF